jgi:hypothetical protein
MSPAMRGVTIRYVILFCFAALLTLISRFIARHACSLAEVLRCSVADFFGRSNASRRVFESVSTGETDSNLKNSKVPLLAHWND